MQKSIWQNSKFIHDRTLIKLEIQGNYLNLIKSIYKNSTGNTIFNVKQ